MADDDRKEKRSGDFRIPPRQWLLWLAIFISIPLLLFVKDRTASSVKPLEQYEFTQKVESNLIVKATINYDVQSPLHIVVGKYYETTPEGKKVLDSAGKPVEVPFKAEIDFTDELKKAVFGTPIGDKFVVRKPNALLLSVLLNILPFVVVALLLWFVFIRQIKMAGKGALSFGKSKARLLSKEKNKMTFKDVAGVDEAKEEVSGAGRVSQGPEEVPETGRAHSQRAF